MRILTRHVLFQLTAVFLFALVALTLMFVIGGAVREAVNQSLPPAQVLRLIPYMLPELLRYTLPITLLLATTTVYARLAGSNEVVAIKSLGISPMVLVWPALALAVAISLVTVWLNDAGVSWGDEQSRRVLVEGVEEIAYARLRQQKTYDAPAFTINVADVRGRKLILPRLTVKARGNTPPVEYSAEDAELRYHREENVLEIILRDSLLVVEDKVILADPDESSYPFPLPDATGSAGSAGPASALSLRVVRTERGRAAEEIVHQQRRMAATATHQLVSGDFAAMTGPDWKTQHRVLAGEVERLYKLEAEPCRRWVAGFSCLCFLWVGVPMAIRRRNSDFLTSFFLCFLPILIVYYPFLIFTIDAAKTGSLPPISMWVGNVLLALWGAYLLRKVLRY